MAGKQHRDWTREEHILAFNLYCREHSRPRLSAATPSLMPPFGNLQSVRRGAKHSSRGACAPLNAPHDHAFDRGQMFIDEAMSVRFREKIIRCEKQSPGLDWLLSYEGKEGCMPRKFRPQEDLLLLHANQPVY
jgi:hypothetical protein